MTRDKGALAKDDRLDALAMAVAYWSKALAVETEKVVQRKRWAKGGWAKGGEKGGHKPFPSHKPFPTQPNNTRGSMGTATNPVANPVKEMRNKRPHLTARILPAPATPHIPRLSQ